MTLPPLDGWGRLIGSASGRARSQGGGLSREAAGPRERTLAMEERDGGVEGVITADIVPPSFSPSGNSLVDNDGALVAMHQWQDHGVHTNAVKVTMMSATPGAQILYTVDGSIPDLASVPARADQVEGLAGAHAGHGMDTAITPDSRATRRYKTGKPVVLEHTADGYTDFVVTAIAVMPDMRQSIVSRSGVYRVQGLVQSVTFDADRTLDTVMLRLASATPGAVIYFEESAQDPRPAHSQVYTEAIRLRSRTVRALAVKQGMTTSRVSEFRLHDQVAPPVPYVQGQTAMSSSLDAEPATVYKDEASVALTHVDDGKPGYSVYYSLNGEVPTTASPKYRGPVKFQMAGTYRLCFVAMAPMLADSSEVWIEFTIMNQVPPPSIWPPSGHYKQQVTLKLGMDADIGSELGGSAGQVKAHASTFKHDRWASIFYTLNGHTPTPTGDINMLAPCDGTCNTYQYHHGDQGLRLSRTDASMFDEGAPLAKFTRLQAEPLRLTVKAVAAMPGLIDSRETSAIIDLLDQVGVPTSWPEPKMYTEVVDITLRSETEGASIYYTMDGSDPRSPVSCPAEAGLTLSQDASPAPSTEAADRRGRDGSPSPSSPHSWPWQPSPAGRVHVYKGTFRITQVGYTRLRAVAMKQNMWDSVELDCEYGVEAQVMVWGCGRNGRLGTGAVDDSFCPVRCSSLYDHSLHCVASGRAHTLMSDKQGRVLSFGTGLHGRLGRPAGDSGGNCLVPTLVPGLDSIRIVSIAAGERHSLLLCNEGNVFSFGDGSMGQLGHGQDSHIGLDGLHKPTRIEAFKWFGVRQDASSSIRRDTVNNKPVTMIAAGAYHSAALTADGLVWLWGRGKDGQLGNGERRDSFLPCAPMASMVEGQSMGLYAKQCTDLALGDWHSAFVCADGEVLTCGRGIEGQLGLPKTSYCLYPQRIHILARQRIKVRQAACGREHTILLDSQNCVWACGNPEDGRLGIAARPGLCGVNQAVDVDAAPKPCQVGSQVSLIGGVEFKTWSGADLGSASGLGGRRRVLAVMPEKIIGLPAGSVRCIVAGADSSAALLDDGSLYVWGKNQHGVLGLNDSASRTAPQLLFTIQGLPIKQISIGASHTIALIDCVGDSQDIEGQAIGTCRPASPVAPQSSYSSDSPGKMGKKSQKPPRTTGRRSPQLP